MGDGDRRPFPLLAAYARRRARACHARQARGRHFSSSGAARGGKEAVERSGRSCRSASSPTPITSGRAPASTGSARSVRSWRAPSSWPRPCSRTGDRRTHAPKPRTAKRSHYDLALEVRMTCGSREERQVRVTAWWPEKLGVIPGSGLMVTRAPEIGPACVRASTTLLNGSEEHRPKRWTSARGNDQAMGPITDRSALGSRVLAVSTGCAVGTARAGRIRRDPRQTLARARPLRMSSPSRATSAQATRSTKHLRTSPSSTPTRTNSTTPSSRPGGSRQKPGHNARTGQHHPSDWPIGSARFPDSTLTRPASRRPWNPECGQ